MHQGDCIHHPHHGIGEVLSIRKRSFSGDTEALFAKLFFKRDRLTVMLRKEDLAKTVRDPIDATEARKLLAYLKSWKGKVSSQWKARANAHQQTMEKGDPFGYAQVYKGLSKLEAEGNLRAADRTHYNQSLSFLSEELANALGKTEDEARAQIEKMAGRVSQ
ncbi:MAG TPA: CarD family transcriptional regulator [Gammaproteobacteria bacterium]|nr:CarD family transcriptional regulator [Gammaproteobacteria bacterium]